MLPPVFLDDLKVTKEQFITQNSKKFLEATRGNTLQHKGMFVEFIR